MKAFGGVADEKWYRYLAARPGLTEVKLLAAVGRGIPGADRR
ncbi:hypothetical protein OG271_25065 [Micromonospora rifamycinica]|nr:hypothetical protein [Micromonospora rifamycinica]